VNDKGEDNDNDKYHVAYSWVVVKLRDINDNKPVFEKSNIEAFVGEIARVGKTLERFRATDPDQVIVATSLFPYFHYIFFLNCSGGSQQGALHDR
jgi:hypothetical protein